MEHLPFVLLFPTFGVLWWLLIVAASVLILWGLDNNRAGVSTFAVITAGIALVLFGETNAASWVLSHPGSILGVIAGYFIGGAIWSVVKWSLYTQDRRTDYEDLKRNWLTEHGVTGGEVPENLKASFGEILLDDYTGRWSKQAIEVQTDENGNKVKIGKKVISIVPIAWENKSRITTWMCFWPWSALWALIDDFVRKVFKRIQRSLEALMDRIAQFHFRDAHNDFTVQGKIPERVEDRGRYENGVRIQ